MTKEKLEKEAEEKFKVNNEDKDREHYYDRMWFKTGYLSGAEPREKQIEELENENKLLGERCNQLLKDKGDLTDKIEKMKCCNNCKFDNLEPPEIISNGVCENCIHHSKWELED